MDISKMKFHPTTPRMRKRKILSYPEPYSSKKERKIVKQATQNKPVLMIGTKKEAITPPRILFFLNNLKTKPATTPATVHFNKQVKIVPQTEMDMNNDKVAGASKTNKPLHNPKNPPTRGPYNIAPTAIGIRDKLIETGPRET